MTSLMTETPPCVRAHLLEDVQDELLVNLVDGHGQRLAVHALAEVSRAHQGDEPPGVKTFLFGVQLQLVVLEALLHPAAPHGLRQLTQEVLDLREAVTRTCVKKKQSKATGFSLFLF